MEKFVILLESKVVKVNFDILRLCLKLGVQINNEVSELLTTYPSPKSQFCPKWEVSVNVDLWEG